MFKGHLRSSEVKYGLWWSETINLSRVIIYDRKRVETVWPPTSSDLKLISAQRSDSKLSKNIWILLRKNEVKKLWSFYDFEFFKTSS